MKNYFGEAKDKLEREYKSGKYDKYGNIMKTEVKKALLDFCRQDDEFAQAVVQGGSFEDCMKAVGKGVAGNGISDLKAYSLAAAFYFPGATIAMQMAINLCGSVEDESDATPTEKTGAMIIDLSAFL